MFQLALPLLLLSDFWLHLDEITEEDCRLHEKKSKHEPPQCSVIEFCSFYKKLRLEQVTLDLRFILAGFEVTVPDKQVKAIRGRPAILGCRFTPHPDISTLVVTWQRQEDSQVVHSFYYQNDQLDRQSSAYRSRTLLYKSELVKGNASLQITAVRPEDTGGYMCVVTNSQGSARALVEVTYGGIFIKNTAKHGNSLL